MRYELFDTRPSLVEVIDTPRGVPHNNVRRGPTRSILMKLQIQHTTFRLDTILSLALTQNI